MEEFFDPYYKWLGIPPKEQPPNHYRLLGVELFELDLQVIESAADRQMAYVRTFQSGPYSAHSQQLLNEISAARVCLLKEDRKAQYDTVLQDELRAKKPLAISVAIQPTPTGSSLWGSPSSLPAPMAMPAIPAPVALPSTAYMAPRSSSTVQDTKLAIGEPREQKSRRSILLPLAMLMFAMVTAMTGGIVWLQLQRTQKTPLAGNDRQGRPFAAPDPDVEKSLGDPVPEVPPHVAKPAEGVNAPLQLPIDEKLPAEIKPPPPAEVKADVAPAPMLAPLVVEALVAPVPAKSRRQPQIPDPLPQPALKLPKGPPDFRAAFLVLALGGRVAMRAPDNTLQSFKPGDAAPGPPYLIEAIELEPQRVATPAEISCLIGLNGLNSLELSGKSIKDDWLKLLRRLPNLQRLALRDTLVTDAGLQQLAGCAKLEQLHVSECLVSDEGLQCLKGLPRLQELMLERIAISDAGLKLLRPLSDLRTLGLRETQITDAGMVHLQHLRRLRILRLSHTEITDDGLARLREMSQLNYLDVDFTKVTEAGVEKFKKSLPVVYVKR